MNTRTTVKPVHNNYAKERTCHRHVILLLRNSVWLLYAMLCRIWYHLHNLKSVKNVKRPWRSVFSKVAGFTKSNTPPWAFFTFFKYKWYQIAQCITYIAIWNNHSLCKHFHSFIHIPSNTKHKRNLGSKHFQCLQNTFWVLRK